MRFVPNGLLDPAIRRFTFIEPVSAIPFPDRQRGSEAAREGLFAALDGRTITAGGHTWQVRVYGICEEPGVWWLQLQLDGTPEYTVTMRTPRFQSPIDTLCRLSNCLASADGDETLTVA